MTPQLQLNQLNPNHKNIQSQSPQHNLSNPNNGQGIVRKIPDKGKRPRRQQRRLEVEVPIESTWAKLSRTMITLPISQYLAENRKAAQDVKLGLTHLHRRKPERKIEGVNRQGQGKGEEPMVINALRTNGLLDEEEYQRSLSLASHTTETDSDYDSEYDDSEYDLDSTRSYILDTDDENDSQIDYPFRAEDM
ncbi:hypothetical protein BD560DRAFT_429243 [Blakeslea trispora]|nr:hypothetical protein BD560DRAFT_429243 [Blakeslea trispora]